MNRRIRESTFTFMKRELVLEGMTNRWITQYAPVPASSVRGPIRSKRCFDSLNLCSRTPIITLTISIPKWYNTQVATYSNFGGILASFCNFLYSQGVPHLILKKSVVGGIAPLSPCFVQTLSGIIWAWKFGLIWELIRNCGIFSTLMLGQIIRLLAVSWQTTL